MAYRVKRIDPFWFRSPIVFGAAVAGGACALLAAQAGSTPIALLCASACAVAVFLATKPALSGVFAFFGLLGGVVTFLASPGGGLAPQTRLLATAGFSLFYMVLMDGVALTVCALYNLFSRAGFRGFSLDLESRV